LTAKILAPKFEFGVLPQVAAKRKQLFKAMNAVLTLCAQKGINRKKRSLKTVSMIGLDSFEPKFVSSSL
jgi:hypothetical protein